MIKYLTETYIRRYTAAGKFSARKILYNHYHHYNQCHEGVAPGQQTGAPAWHFILGGFSMHMADALLSPAVGGTLWAASAGAVGYAVTKIERDSLSEKKIPLMAVSGAFVFAAQMINFTIPGTGSSGHIGGGLLLAALLGGFPALLCISAVLIIQCLFFADGGLLALGCNIFNMGVIPCLVVYPLLFKPLARKNTLPALSVAAFVSVVAGLQLGALGVVLETQASGITQLPFGVFLLWMQPIHLAIGAVEGIVTGAVLCFVYKMRPEILEAAGKPLGPVPVRAVVLALVGLTVVTGGVLSLFASAYPDGLEWSLEKTAGTAELPADGPVFENAARLQEATAFMPDYDYKAAGEDAPAGTSVAGLAGGVLVFALAGGTGLLLSALKKSGGRG
jgi:cobalt/nickel transport system permease protein